MSPADIFAELFKGTDMIDVVTDINDGSMEILDDTQAGAASDGSDA